MATCILCKTYSSADQRAGETSASPVPDRDFVRVVCFRCGEYLVSNEMWEAEQVGLAEDQGLALSALARTATDSGGKFELDYPNLDRLIASARRPRSYAEHVNAVLLEVARRCKYPGVPTAQTPLEQIAARTYLPASACDHLVGLLSTEGLLNVLDGDLLRMRLQLRPAGWTRVDQLQTRATGETAFVAMWFSDELRPAFENAMKPALLACGYEPPFRVDDLEHEARASQPDFQPRIDDRIIAEIRRARFVVADITGARPAVYYEAGFAMGLGIPVLWTGRNATFSEDKCFDTQQFGHIVWAEPDDLRHQLETRIKARGWTRSGPSGSA